ncbi:MAG: type VI secretion system baseplate subunit TssG [Candidatus Manganitrophaceae bacterium]
MGTPDRPAGDPLKEKPFPSAERFSFFQIVHLIERYYRPVAPVGGGGPASEEVIRFRPEASLSFPSSDLAEIEEIVPEGPEGNGRTRYLITTRFLGLYGTTSPLPTFYTEDLLRRESDDETVRHFLDLFHHRLLSLFYRSWAKYRYHVTFDEGKDPFSRRMFGLIGLIGLGTPGLSERANQADRTAFPAVRLIRYAGLLTQRPRSAAALEGVLNDFFHGIPIQITQCMARWVAIPAEQRLRLGRANGHLGIDASLGEKVLGRATDFRITLGPIGYSDFKRFLPGETSLRSLQSLVDLFVSDRLRFDIALQLNGSEIPPLRVAAGGEARLGWTTWLATKPPVSDRAQPVVFS